MKVYKTSFQLVLVMFILLVSTTFSSKIVLATDAIPALPASFYGNVLINGRPAPVGTIITADILGEPRGETVVTTEGWYGGEGLFGRLIINGDSDTTNRIIHFDIQTPSMANKIRASEDARWFSGTLSQVDLTFSGEEILKTNQNNNQEDNQNNDQETNQGTGGTGGGIGNVPVPNNPNQNDPNTFVPFQNSQVPNPIVNSPYEKIIPKIEVGIPITVNPDNGIHLYEIRMLSRINKENVKIKVSEFTREKLPSPTPPVLDDIFYFDISLENFQPEGVQTAVLYFRLDKDFLTANGIDPETIQMQRFAGGGWIPIPTFKRSENAKYYSFKADTPGFSYFAITGESSGLANQGSQQNSNSNLGARNDNQNFPNNRNNPQNNGGVDINSRFSNNLNAGVSGGNLITGNVVTEKELNFRGGGLQYAGFGSKFVYVMSMLFIICLGASMLVTIVAKNTGLEVVLR